MHRSDKISFPAYFAFFFSILLFASFVHARDEGIIAEAPLGEYVGSKSCEACHAIVYTKWSKRLKADFVRFKKDESGHLPGNWADIPYKDDDDMVNENDVLLLVGRKRKVAFVDDSWTVIPFEYFFKTGEWRRRGGWARNQYDYRERCASCHTVASNPETLEFKELNIGCEACHGPGKSHLENQKKNSIRVPGKSDGKNVLETCRKCHNNRKNHTRAIQNFSGKFHR